MRKTVLLSFAALILFSCGNDPQPQESKLPKTADTPRADTADTLVRQEAVPPAYPLPAGVEINTKLLKGDTVYLVADPGKLEDLFYRDVDWSMYPGVVDYDSAFAAQPAPDWKRMPVDTLLKAIFRFVDFSQMCDAEEPRLPDVFDYAVVERNEFAIKSPGFQKLRNRRREVIDHYLADKDRTLTTDDLLIFTDLNAVEMLPVLLERERRLRRLALAAADGKLYSKEYPDDKGKNYTAYAVGRAYNYTLATICAILRQEGYEALVSSDMEADLKKQILKFAKENAPSKETRDLEKQGYYFTCTDPVHQVMTGVHVSVEAPVNKANTERIAYWTDDYIRRLLPEAAKTAGTRMTDHPMVR